MDRGWSPRFLSFVGTLTTDTSSSSGTSTNNNNNHYNHHHSHNLPWPYSGYYYSYLCSSPRLYLIGSLFTITAGFSFRNGEEEQTERVFNESSVSCEAEVSIHGGPYTALAPAPEGTTPPTSLASLMDVIEILLLCYTWTPKWWRSRWRSPTWRTGMNSRSSIICHRSRLHCRRIPIQAPN